MVNSTKHFSVCRHDWVTPVARTALPPHSWPPVLRRVVGTLHDWVTPVAHTALPPHPWAQYRGVSSARLSNTSSAHCSRAVPRQLHIAAAAYWLIRTFTRPLKCQKWDKRSHVKTQKECQNVEKDFFQSMQLFNP